MLGNFPDRNASMNSSVVFCEDEYAGYAFFVGEMEVSDGAGERLRRGLRGSGIELDWMS